MSLLLLYILMFSNNLFSQKIPDNYIYIGNVLSDKETLENSVFEEILPPITESKNTLEIRVLELYDMKPDTIKVLYFDSHWKTKKYERKTKKVIKSLDDEVEILKIFNTLIENEIFNLKDDNSVNINKTYFDVNSGKKLQMISGVLHATVYFIEFKVGDDLRSYAFRTPNIKHNPKIPQLVNYQNIINAISKI